MDRIELGVPDGKQEQQAACCFVVLVLCWAMLGGCVVAHPGSMKRAGPELLPFSHSSNSQFRGGGEGSITGRATSPSHHSTTRRSATQGHGRAAAASSLHHEGNWSKERNDKTNGMAPGQQACVPLRMRLLCTMVHTHRTRCCSCRITTRSPWYTASHTKAGRRHDTMFN